MKEAFDLWYILICFFLAANVYVYVYIGMYIHTQFLHIQQPNERHGIMPTEKVIAN